MRTFLLEHYLWIKSLHIIAIIAWMAGMMYLPRLFVYHHESEPGGEAEKFFIQMERRLLKGIINPAMMAVWILGITMIIANPSLFSEGWFHFKLVLVLGISAIHGFYAGARRKFEAGERPRTQKFWRIMNEIPFLALIVVVILAVTKPF